MSEAKPKKNVLIRKVQFPMAYGLLMAANGFDAFFKILQFSNYDTQSESLRLLKTLGLVGFIAYKIALTLAIILLCEVMSRKRKVLAGILIWLATALVCFLAVRSTLECWEYMGISR